MRIARAIALAAGVTPLLLSPQLEAQPTTSNTVTIETFLNADPGHGNGIWKTVTLDQLDQAMAEMMVDTSGLQVGSHTLGIRVWGPDPEAEGYIWGNTMTFPLHVQLEEEVVDITPGVSRLEYFFGTDPGVGQASEIDLPEDTQYPLSFNATIPPQDLEPGAYVLGIRAIGNDGVPGFLNRRLVVLGQLPVHDPLTHPEVDYVEYFFDQDPGLGNGIPAAVPPHNANAPVTLPVTMDLSNLEPGFRILGLRARTSLGTWTQTVHQGFVLQAIPVSMTSHQINRVHYRIFSGETELLTGVVPVQEVNGLVSARIALPTAGEFSADDALTITVSALTEHGVEGFSSTHSLVIIPETNISSLSILEDDSLTILFQADPGLTGWKVKATSDLSSGFPQDLSPQTIINEVTPGNYEADINYAPETDSFFLRIERDTP